MVSRPSHPLTHTLTHANAWAAQDYRQASPLISSRLSPLASRLPLNFSWPAALTVSPLGGEVMAHGHGPFDHWIAPFSRRLRDRWIMPFLRFLGSFLTPTTKALTATQILRKEIFLGVETFRHGRGHGKGPCDGMGGVVDSSLGQGEQLIYDSRVIHSMYWTRGS